MKKCSKCYLMLELNNFRKDKSKKDWYYSSCNSCYRKKYWIIKKTISSTWMECKTRFYRCWNSAKQRCNNKNDYAYKNYWYRWIKCNWETYSSFKSDMYESYLIHSNQYWENNTTIERIDVNGNYCKENCKWATYKEQWRNKRTTKRYLYNWEYKTIWELSEISWIMYKTLYARLNIYWYSIQESLNTDMHFKKRN